MRSIPRLLPVFTDDFFFLGMHRDLGAALEQVQLVMHDENETDPKKQLENFGVLQRFPAQLPALDENGMPTGRMIEKIVYRLTHGDAAKVQKFLKERPNGDLPTV